jgi:photosystem II stability/assembly factor-like uncharacterized protein
VFVRPAVAASLLLLFAGVRIAGAQEDEGGRASAARSAVINQSRNPILASFRFRAIGPASMGGRVDDIEVAPSNHSIVYAGFATGGVFKSVNNAVTFEPIFETYSTASIGDIAVHPTNPDIVYVGTGEPNNRQSTSFGDGIYKTIDGGKTFTHIGLRETQTIARVVIDPRSPEVVYVAAPGHLFGPSPDGGLYKTINGGKSWTKIKYVDEHTGFTELVMDPSNSNVLYAASYQRQRTVCCYNGGGPGSAIWKTTDAGKSWTKLSAGLPPGPYGRISMDVSRSNPKIVYAQVEAGFAHLIYPPDKPGAAPETPAAMPAEVNTTPGGDAARYWCNNAAAVAAAARPGRSTTTPAPPSRRTPILDPTQGGMFRSEDGGRTWTAKSNCAERPMYFAQVRVDPNNPNVVYTAGGSPQISRDGGVLFEKLASVHSDVHALWIDPTNSNHLIVGNDGGVNMSYDQGEKWDFVNSLATGQSYSVVADNERPYNVYTGMQDNGTWGGPSSSRARAGILNGDWFKLPCVGDGFTTAVNWDHPNLVYCEGQDGAIQRFDLSTGRGTSVRPISGPAGPRESRPCVDGRAPDNPRLGRRGGRRTVLNATAGESYRFNWNTPFILSPHNPDIVYLAGNRLFKSYDRGDHWVESPDLTKQIDRCDVAVMGVAGDQQQLAKNDGVEWYSTIVAIDESHAMPGVVWAGTDDGNLQVSRDGGLTFTDVTAHLPGLPAQAAYYISRIDASSGDAGTAVVAVDGHRSDDMRPYVFVTHDYGRTFQSIANDLPSFGNVHVVRQDPKNADLLFAGTEVGLYVSINGGKHWEPFMTNYPTVRTDDIVIHPRDGDLIVGTHGRSLFIADDITALEQFTPTVAAKDVHVFEPRETVAYVQNLMNNPDLGGVRKFVAENAPAGPSIAYYLKGASTGDVRITVTDAMGRTMAASSAPHEAGIHKLSWAQLIAGSRAGEGVGHLDAGIYAVKLSVNGADYTRSLTVLEDRGFRAR